VPSSGNIDTVTITLADAARPVVVNPSALDFSVFDWIFN
jgi:hypothetical protein